MSRFNLGPEYVEARFIASDGSEWHMPKVRFGECRVDFDEFSIEVIPVVPYTVRPAPKHRGEYKREEL